MTRQTRLLSALTAAGLATLGTAAGAQAAITATFDHPCYSRVPTVGTQPVVVALAGGVPNTNYLLAFSVPGGPGEGSAGGGGVEGVFDAAGNATATVTDVSPPQGGIDPTPGGAIDVSIRDYVPNTTAVPQPVGQIQIAIAGVGFASKPRSPRAHRAVTVSFAPYAGQPISVFVTKPNSTKVLRRTSLGTADACGYVKGKAVVAPSSNRAGKYRLYANPGTKLVKTAAIFTTFSIFRY